MLNKNTFNFLKDWNKINFTTINKDNKYIIGINHIINNSLKWELVEKKLNIDEVYDLLLYDLNTIQINNYFVKISVTLKEYQKDALIALIFDLGYLPESIILLINSNNFRQLKIKWLSLYNKEKNINKSYRKRLAEWDLFCNEYKSRKYYQKFKII